MPKLCYISVYVWEKEHKEEVFPAAVGIQIGDLFARQPVSLTFQLLLKEGVFKLYLHPVAQS